jgi:hypothetical protein
MYVICIDATLFYKALSDEGIPVSVILPAQSVLKPLLLKTEYYHLAVIVDVVCEDSIHFLAEVRQLLQPSSLECRDNKSFVSLR